MVKLEQVLEVSQTGLVFYNNRQLFDFTKGIKIGIGVDEYVLSRGAFRFKEKVHKYHYDFLETNGQSITFKHQNHKIVMDYEVINDYVAFKFSYTDRRINRVYLSLQTTADEYPYGCGEQFAAFNLKNKKVKNWVSEHVAFANLMKKAAAASVNVEVPLMDFERYASYMVQPTFITNKKMFVHLGADSYSHFEFKDKEILIEVREPLKDMYIGFSEDYEALMENLTSLLGRQPLLPEWVFDGMMLGIQDGTLVCDRKANKMLEKGAAINGIWAQDWEGQRITRFGKQLMWDWKYDEKLYYSLPDYIKKWEDQNIRFLGYINPFLAIEGELYKEASNRGLVVKNKDGKDYMVTITTFPAAMIDLTNPEGFDFMKNVIKKNMIDIGLKGWMADFAEYLPTDAVLYSGEDPRIIHNTWPVRWAKCNEEAVAEAGMSDEIFFFVRAGYTGTGKHAKIMWNGDQHVDWSRDYGIGSIVNSQLSLGVTGIGNSHSDIGGYTTFGLMNRSKELLLRWTEMNTFSMIMRSHEGNQPEKNHQFDSDDETMEHIARFTKIYKHLKPYRIDLDHENHEKGVPSIRPLFFYYDFEKYKDTDDQYLLGRDLLVCPVIKKEQTKMNIVLPDDEWIHLFTGEEYDGGEVTIDCPIGTPAVFYRKSSRYSDLFENLTGL